MGNRDLLARRRHRSVHRVRTAGIPKQNRVSFSVVTSEIISPKDE